MREAFEKWMSARGCKFQLGRGGDCYSNPLTQRDWETWQAALQSQKVESGLGVTHEMISAALEAALAAAPQPAHSPDGGDVAGWQFYQDGKWHNGDDRIKDHRANTEAAGIPVRDVYTHPAQSRNELQAEAIKTLRENIRQEGRTVQQVGIRDNDKTRAAIAALLDSDARLRSDGGEG